jgi:dienelactone hydrolase
MVNSVLRTLRFSVLVMLLGACGSESKSTGAAPDGAAPDSGVPGQNGGTSNVGGGTQKMPGGGGGGVSSGGGGGNSSGGATGSGGGGGTAGGDAGGGTPRPNVDRSNPQLYEFELDPHVLDPRTVDSLSLQYAQLDTRTAPLGKLVIFLPGATNVPRDWRDHGRELAKFGFHVLIPHYNNRWSSDGTCTGCGDDARWEALVGEDTSSAIAISRADSAEGRVVTMIKHLITAHPGGDWGYYLAANDELSYGKMIIAGISHGAASAGMYAARRSFSRNVMHSSGPAGSASAAKLTPLSEWYAFAHTADPAYDAIVSSWERFALVGAPTSIDGLVAPFGNSHRLTASTASTYPHGSTCAHSSSPKDASGNYVFEPAWRYLYGAPTP